MIDVKGSIGNVRIVSNIFSTKVLEYLEGESEMERPKVTLTFGEHVLEIPIMNESVKETLEVFFDGIEQGLKEELEGS